VHLPTKSRLLLRRRIVPVCWSLSLGATGKPVLLIDDYLQNPVIVILRQTIANRLRNPTLRPTLKRFVFNEANVHTLALRNQAQSQNLIGLNRIKSVPRFNL
jgi:hypothetical protein